MNYFKQFYITILVLTCTSLFAQRKTVSIRDIGGFQNYNLFTKYRGSLNKLHNVDKEVEYIDQFKLYVKIKDSIQKVRYAEEKLKYKEEYVRETNLNDYLGVYTLEEVSTKKFDSYNATMYVSEEGISIIPDTYLRDTIRCNYDYQIRKLLKGIKFMKGAFFLYNKNDDCVVTISEDKTSASLAVNKKVYSFKVSKYIK